MWRSLVSALDWGSRGRGFESRLPDVIVKRNFSHWSGFWDSVDHYRRHVGLNVVHAMYRAAYYEIKRKEPYA